MSLNKDIPARDDLYQCVQYLRKDFTYEDNGKVLRVGALPARAVILKTISGVHVSTAFGDGTINIGDAADDGLYGSGLSLTALGPVALGEAVSMIVARDTEVTATVATNATAGEGQVIIAYVHAN